MDQKIQEILKLIPTRSACLEALERAPHLLHTESPFAVFLERENGNVAAAATRLTLYWEFRKQVYGDRAVLPLSSLQQQQAGEAMRSRPIERLPKDAESCNVFFLDRSCIADASSSLSEAIYQCSHAVLHDESSRSRGVVGLCLINLSHQGLPFDGVVHSKAILDLVEHALPIRIKALHILFLASTEMTAFVQNNVVPSLLECFVGRSFAPVISLADSADGLANKLATFGLRKENLPQSLGGALPGTNRSSRGVASFLSPDAQHTSLPPSSLQTSQALGPLYTHLKLANTLKAQSTAHYAPAAGTSLPAAAGAVYTLSDFPVPQPPVRPTNQRATPYLGGHPDTRVIPSSSSLTSGSGIYTTNHLDETSTLHSEALQRLKEAIDGLPGTEKAAYITATRTAPHLIERESNPLNFLRFEKYNTWSAAQRLANYWKWRLKVFSDRCFLPMTLNGHGALSNDDIQAFRSGYLTILPKDTRGRSVVFYDPSRITNRSSLIRWRIAFYVLHVLHENPKTMSDGFVIIGNVDLSAAPIWLGKGDTMVKDAPNLWKDCFPGSSSMLHLVKSPSGLGERLFFEGFVPIVVNSVRHVFGDRLAFHVGDKTALLLKLMAHGFVPSTLPESLGGSLTAQGHLQWIEDRVERENSEFQIAKSYHATHEFDLHQKLAPLKSSPSRFGAGAGDELSILRLQTKQAIDNLVPREKEAYLQALQHAPDVVEKESNLDGFLRLEHMNPVRTAARLARYWQTRLSVFGDRALLPLNQSGEGALDRRDLSVLGTTYLMILPTDNKGRPVIFCDGSRLSKSSRESRLRCSFYLFSVAAESSLAQLEGVSLIYMATEPSFDQANNECLDLVFQTLPISVHHVHLILPIECKDPTNAEMLDEIVDRGTRDKLEKVARRGVAIHSLASREEISEALAGYGLATTYLPVSLGGQFGFDRFLEWQELRLRYEWDLPAFNQGKAEAAWFSYDFGHVKSAIKMTAEEKMERKRRLNVIHSRRKRERQRLKFEMIEEECSSLWNTRRELKREGRRLEMLLEQAMTFISEENL